MNYPNSGVRIEIIPSYRVNALAIPSCLLLACGNNKFTKIIKNILKKIIEKLTFNIQFSASFLSLQPQRTHTHTTYEESRRRQMGGLICYG